MDQPPPSSQPEPPPLLSESPSPSPAAAPAPATSLAARLLNVFATPGDVFDEVKVSRTSVANWLVPILLYGLVGAFSSVLILSQPAIAQQIHERQQKVFEDQVKAGKMTREQADSGLSMAEKFSGPAVLKVFGAIGAFFGSFISVFGWAFLLWLIARFGLKAKLDFMKVVEIAGLASAINMLETLVKMLLVFGLSNPLASPSLALLLKNPDPKNGLFALLNLVNIMTFWALAVRAIGVAKLAAAPVGKAALWVFGLWLLLMSLLLGLSGVAQKAFGG